VNKSRALTLCTTMGLGCLMLFPGCGSSYDIEEIKNEVKTGYNQQLSSKGVSFTCTSVELVAESDNKYIGFAELSNGQKPKVTVTIGTDGKYIWEVEPALDLPQQ
jgi:hypothetical protein